MTVGSSVKSKKLRDIFTPNIISISPETPVSRTMEIMRENDISCVVVLEDNKLTGIVTERNLVKFAVKLDGQYQDCVARKLMSSPVITVNKDMDIFEAHNLFSLHKIRHLVVTDENAKPLGLVTQSDIVTLLSLESFIGIKILEDVMSPDVFVLDKNALVSSALEKMAQRAVSCIVVVQENKPIGILTERDVARLLIKYENIGTMQLSEVMSTSIKSVSKMISLNEAVDQMRKNQLRRLVIVDDNGHIEGLATQSDIVKGLEGKYIERLHEIIIEKNEVIQNTARDLAEKSIYLHNILSSSADYGLIAFDLNLKVLFFNKGAEKILELKSDGIVGRDGCSLQPWAGERVIHSQKILNLLKQGERYQYTYKQDNPTGIKFINVSASSITDKSNNLTGFLLMVTDETKRKNTERQLYLAHENLEQRVHRRTRQLEKAMEGTIKAMAMTVELRDPYTSGHQRRVAHLAHYIASELVLDKEVIQGVYMAGLIHDIGKIRVPSDFLCHTGILTDAELAILKHHPATGYSILEGIEFPWPVAEVVMQHHERIDGSGYPLGLKGDQIMKNAKILAVADVVEAMSSHRPYRPALGIDSALDEIDSNKGIQYETEIVEVCLHLFKKNNYVFPSSSSSLTLC